MTAPSDRIATVPNLISGLRVVGVGWFLWLLLGRSDVVAAAIVLAVIGSTDWVDGFLARRLDQVSEFGRKLDPIADRLALVAAVVGGFIARVDGVRLLPTWLVVGILAREVVMAATVWWLHRRTGETLQVRWLGKAATFLLYAAIPVLYLAAAGPVIGVGAWLRTVGLTLGAVGLALYVWVAVQYIAETAARVSQASHPTT